MAKLKVEHIEIIISDVSNAGITFSHLREELIDHICCEVENEIFKGFSFEEAYEKVKTKIGHKGLKKIQENTLFLIDKNYRIMKKTMRLFGVVSMAMMAVGAIFKIQHYPGAGILLTISFALMGLVFLPSALYVMKREITMKGSTFIFITGLFGGIALLGGVLFKIQHWPGSGILLLAGYLIICIALIPAILVSRLRDKSVKHLHSVYILGAFSIAIYLLGDLFKTMHYPGASPMLLVGATLLTAVFLPIYAYKMYSNTTYVKGGFIFLCIGIFFFNLFNILLAINVSKDVFNSFMKPIQEVEFTSNFIQTENAEIITQLSNIKQLSDSTLFKKIEVSTDELNNFIEDIKQEIIIKTDGCSKAEAIEKNKNPQFIIAKDNKIIPTEVLCGEEPGDSLKKGFILKSKINSLKAILLKASDRNNESKTLINKALETANSAETNESKSVPWEFNQFYHLPIIAAITKLNYLQRNVRIAEMCALQNLEQNKNISK
ncbi:MAG: hypothetical protein HXX09_07900 [Bacteroidetes bacterium]|nr:hypothetical protein [Bacteroidota bacterium]